LTDPLVATLLHGAALWAWHMPVLYDLVLTNVVFHRLQHLSFFVTALLFWWSLLHPRNARAGSGLAVFCLFVTALHSGLLGLLLSLSRRPWYPGQGALAESLGLTVLEDQQLAGLVMWVPMGLIYTGVALALAARWIRRSSSTISIGIAHVPAE
jgi:cytochrome c oxidase assembly factor CtaG